MLSIVLLSAYSVVNLVLAYAGSAVYPVGAAVGWAVKGPATALFLLAGAVLAAGVLTRSSWLIGAGLVLASVAPAVYGAMVEGNNILLHHAVRAALAAGMMALWLYANRVPQSA